MILLAMPGHPRSAKDGKELPAGTVSDLNCRSRDFGTAIQMAAVIAAKLDPDPEANQEEYGQQQVWEPQSRLPGT